MRVHMRLASTSDHDVHGLSDHELAEFYHGLAIKIATHLSRVQVPVSDSPNGPGSASDVAQLSTVRCLSDRAETFTG